LLTKTHYLRKAKRLLERGLILISDDTPNFHEALNKEFWTRESKARHFIYIRLRVERDNNKIERMNIEIRDKVMRELKIGTLY
jgi:hypothetical protein